MKENEHSFYAVMLRKKNPLLIRSELGKSKEPVDKLPPLTHTYGSLKKFDKENATAILTSWEVHIPTNPNLKTVSDYKKLNKLGVVFKITDPKQVKLFRNNNKCLMKIKRKRLNKSCSVPSESFIYGIKNKPSTPIKKVLEYDYAKKASEKTHEFYLSLLPQKPKIVQTTKHSRSITLPPASVPFTLSRFTKIKSKLKFD